MVSTDEIVSDFTDDLDFDVSAGVSVAFAAHRPSPQSNGNLQVDPEIRLPSPGMDVEISYFYNSWTAGGGPYGFGRTISTNLGLIASANPRTVKLIRGDGATSTFGEFEPGRYGKGRNGSSAKVTLDTENSEWIELNRNGVKNIYPVVPDGEISKVARIVDSVGNRHVYTYNDKGLLVHLTDTIGRQVAFHYNSADLLSSIIDWAGRRTTFEYDALTNVNRPVMTKVTGPTGCQTFYRYTPDGALTDIIDPNGYETNYGYDKDGRVSRRSIKGVGDTTYDYDFSQMPTEGKYTRLVTDAAGNKTSEIWGSDDRIISRTSPLGRTVSRAHDPGSGSTTKHVNGRIVRSNTHDRNGNLNKTVDAAGLQTTYTYDDFGNETSSTRPDGVVTKKIWGVEGSPFDETGAKRRLQVYIDENGNRTTHEYNSFGQCVSTTNVHGGVTRYAYDHYGNLESRTAPDGATLTFRHDAAGNVIEKTEPNGAITHTKYDEQGRPKQVTDPAGNITQFGYDGNGNKTIEIDALGNRSEWSYNVWDKVEKFVSPAGRIIRYSYDKLGNKISAENGLGSKASLTYDADGNVNSVVDAAGGKMLIDYDSDGHPAIATDALGRKTSVIYDEADRPISQMDNVGNRLSVAFDAYGRLGSYTEATGGTTCINYDELGRRSQLTDALGSTTSYAYNNYGLKCEETNALGHAIRFGYDSEGRETSVTDAKGNTTKADYDYAGRLLSRADPAGRITTYKYDLLGNKLRTTSPDGSWVSSTFDSLSREMSRDSSTGEHHEFTYDADGYRIAETDGSGETRFEYDLSGKLTRKLKENCAPIIFRRDSLGRIGGWTESNECKAIYSYDVLGRQTKVLNGRGEVTTTQYMDQDSTTVTHQSNGVVLTKSVDASNRETVRKLVAGDGRVLASFESEYDLAGRRIRVIESDGTQTAYAYDAAGQLTAEIRSGGAVTWELQYNYDCNGNRISKIENDGLTIYSYGPCDELLSEKIGSAEPIHYAYDANGRLVSKLGADGQIKYSWDAAGRLARVIGPGDAEESYTYGAAGIRISRRTLDGETDFIIVGQNVVAERKRSGATVAEWTHSSDKWGSLIAEHRDNQTYTFGFDASANTRLLMNSSGRIVSYIAYDSFGVERALAGEMARTPLRFGGSYGYWHDRPDSVYVRARYYNTTAGSWLSRDPLAFASGDWNLYRYVRGNPVSWVDPSGATLCSVCDSNYNTELTAASVLETTAVALAIALEATAAAACVAGDPLLVVGCIAEAISVMKTSIKGAAVILGLALIIINKLHTRCLCGCTTT